MAIEDLLKKAVAAFNALSPEQQAEMMEEQRQSWVRGNVGLSRDERGMTSPVMPRPAPADLKARDRKRYKLIRKSLQNKGLLPAATDTGLETVGYWLTGHTAITTSKKEWSSWKLDPYTDELVTRSQAEELLAAERAESERLRAYILRAEKAEADNAAQAARIKELEKDFYDADKSDMSARDLLNDREAEIEALEAKLAAANEKIEEAYRLGHLNGRCGGTGPTEDDDWKEARAALGGKP